MAHPRRDGDDRPAVSIVVPARGEEAVLPHTLPPILEAAGRLRDRGHRVELLVVVPAWSGVWVDPPADAPEVRWIETPRDGKYEAMRAGVSRAGGEVVLFFDADVLVSRDAVAHLAEPLLRGVADVVAGRIDIARSPRGPVARLLASWSRTSALSWHRLRTECPQLLWALPGAVWGLRRSLFPTDVLVASVDDVSLGLALRESGAAFRYVPAAVVRTWAPDTLEAWYQQKIRARSGWALLARRRGEEMVELQTMFRVHLAATRGRGPSALVMELQDRVIRRLARHRLDNGHPATGAWATVRSPRPAPVSNEI